MNMTMGSAVPSWLTPVAWAYIALALLSTAVFAVDIYLGRRRHDSVASELVWIASGLYLGPFAVPVYLARGRTHAPAARKAGVDAQEPSTSKGTAVAVLPGGGASAAAHLVAVPLVAAVGWTIAGLAMWPMIIVIAVLAVLIVAVYERAASSATTRGRRLTVGAALFAGLVTVAAFDVGMVGWMLLLHLNDAMPAVSQATFWFLMQIGVIIGLATGYPAVKWLLGHHATVTPA